MKILFVLEFKKVGRSNPRILAHTSLLTIYIQLNYGAPKVVSADHVLKVEKLTNIWKNIEDHIIQLLKLIILNVKECCILSWSDLYKTVFCWKKIDDSINLNSSTHFFNVLFRTLTMVLSQLFNIVFMYVFIAEDTYRNNFNHIIILTNLW